MGHYHEEHKIKFFEFQVLKTNWVEFVHQKQYIIKKQT